MKHEQVIPHLLSTPSRSLHHSRASLPLISASSHPLRRRWRARTILLPALMFAALSVAGRAQTPVVTATTLDNIAVINSSNHAQIQITRTGSTSSALNVRYWWAGTAATWDDYRFLDDTTPDNVTIPAGQSSFILTFKAVGVNDVGEPETAGIQIIDDAAYDPGSPTTAMFDIYTTEPPTTPIVTATTIDDLAVINSTNYAQIRIDRTGSTSSSLNVRYWWAGTAATWDDYRYLDDTTPDNVTIPAGQSSFILTFKAVGVNNVGEPETAGIQLIDEAAYDPGSPDTAMFNIYTTEPITTPVVTATTLDNIAVINSTNYAQIQIMRTGSTSSALTVRYFWAGTAATWDDYRFLDDTTPDNVTIPAGQSSFILTFKATGVNNVGEPETAGIQINDQLEYDVGTPSTAMFDIYTTDPGGQQAATPTFNPPGGNYGSAQSVTISTTTSGATIHYTQDGSTPTTSSPVYSSPIAVSSTMTLNAIAVASGFAQSQVGTATYTIGSPPAATPTFDPPGGNYSSTQNVAIATTTPGATIHFTQNGSPATTSSPTYTGPITISAATTLRAIAVAPGYSQSAEGSASYTIGTTPGSAYAKADYIDLMPPATGEQSIHLLTPTVIELVRISQKTSPTGAIDHWDYVSGGSYNGPGASAFTVTVNSQPVTVQQVGFKRRTLYAPRAGFDLRMTNSLFLKLASAVPDNATVAVTFSDGSFNTVADPLRFNPALHVNQEGYMPNWQKKAFVGYYLGNLGELDIASGLQFEIVDLAGASFFSGTLQPRNEVNNDGGVWYNQKVFEADFSGFNPPSTGLYMLKVAGMGASLPFLIDQGIAMGFARTYALGLYHQRCGMAITMPFSRFTHDACHDAGAKVPLPEAAFRHVHQNAPWDLIEDDAIKTSPGLEPQTAPALTNPGAAVLPFRRTGAVDVSGGHHDAGDYSKYTNNSADLIHFLVFAADSLPGVGELDNLGIPESGNTISDLLDEAKWEADFLVKMQDITGSWSNPNVPPQEGGFHYLVYPRYGRYDGGPPNNGLEQAVWPLQTSATASAVAALAQIGSSPAFIQAYPAKAEEYRKRAKLGWDFLMTKITDPGEAISEFGNDRTRPSNAFQRLLTFGLEFADLDDLVWAACQMYLATGDTDYEDLMKAWYEPGTGATIVHGFRHMSKSYGNAVRSYVFAVQSGRLASGAQDATYLQTCVDEAYVAADAALLWSQRSAYGLSLPDPAKSGPQIGWFFASSQAFDIAVGHALSVLRNDSKPRQAYLDAFISNLDFEAGCNPVNATTLTGIGMKRQKVMVHQWSDADHRLLPLTGIPIGSVREITVYSPNPGNPVEGWQNAVVFPSETGQSYALYDRWSDNWNVSAEFTHLLGARALGSLAYVAKMTSAAAGNWTPAPGTILNLPSTVTAGVDVTVTFQPPTGMSLQNARVVWETVGGQSGYGETFTFKPTSTGVLPWIEAEATWPDGRRAFAVVNNIPGVSFDLGASTLTAQIGGSDGTLVLTRDGDLSSSLQVWLKWTGSGTGNWDFAEVPSVTFPTNADTVSVNVDALRNEGGKPDPYVHVTFETWTHEQSYRVRNPSGATVNFVP